jgi:hypothetical protein
MPVVRSMIREQKFPMSLMKRSLSKLTPRTTMACSKLTISLSSSATRRRMPRRRTTRLPKTMTNQLLSILVMPRSKMVSPRLMRLEVMSTRLISTKVGLTKLNQTTGMSRSTTSEAASGGESRRGSRKSIAQRGIKTESYGFS